MSEPTPPQLRTDRVGLLVEQLADGVQLSRLRIDGLTDDEFTWEPYTGMWSIRPRHEAATPDAYGPGAFVLDHISEADPFAGGPPTTIAWRTGHLVSAYAGRFEWTFGERRADPQLLVDFVPDTSMLETLWTEIDRWVAAIENMSDEQLDVPGYGQYPHGLDPDLPFIAIIRWMNRETIHHLAEIALLRDLYASAHAT